MRPTNDRKTIRPQFVGGIPGHVLDADYFYFDHPPESQAPILITCGGWEQCAADFVLKRTSYPHWFIIFTLEGRGKLKTQGNTFTLTPGTISGFKPGTPHYYCCDPQHPMEQIFVVLVGSEVEKLFSQCGLLDSPALRVSDAPTCQNLIEQLLQTGLEHGPYAQSICRHYFEIILLKLASDPAGSYPQHPVAWHTYQTCQSYVNKHFTQIKSPADVAIACDIDVRYLSALFKRFGSTAPHKYLMRLKLNRAADLLLTTSLSVKEIAIHVGFDDPYHFSRNFKKFHCCSPKQYRANHQ